MKRTTPSFSRIRKRSIPTTVSPSDFSRNWQLVHIQRSECTLINTTIRFVDLICCYHPRRFYESVVDDNSRAISSFDFTIDLSFVLDCRRRRKPERIE